ncbi:hypothetical protein BDV25DRAFT_151827 [Aspergillus avenaceus]|uniref:Uncharacterized protein n=1 Tax=Aspergillus avenaceus TaxID=36643 RepID=A0A5N6U089_ASPAV|nr:hypothetical protein BDV25DRAFT_151827 [Aspergillus avenaceus]
MSADQLLYQMEHSSQGKEWYDFDNFFEFPSDYLDSNPTSVDSISPKDFDLTFNDTDGLDWDAGLDMCSQLPFTDLVNHQEPFQDYFEPSMNVAPVSDPTEFMQLPPTSPKQAFVGSVFENSWLSDAGMYDDHFYSTIRHMVESQAAADPRCSSTKEKRREAAIALHLQRLQDAPVPDRSPDSSTSFSSPQSISRNAPCASPATTPISDSTSKSPTPASGTDSTPGGMELVLDLNMNTPANLPRKQKPRSRAQKENYIKVRKHGACEKHRKQHKRCNCLDIAASRTAVNKSALSTNTSVLELTRKARLPLQSPTPVRIISREKETHTGVLPPNVQSPKLAVRSHVEKGYPMGPGRPQPNVIVPSVDVSRGKRPMSVVSKPAQAVNTGQARLQVSQQSTVLETWRGTTWRGVNRAGDMVSILPSKPLVTTSVQQRVTNRTNGLQSVNRSAPAGLDRPHARSLTQRNSESGVGTHGPWQKGGSLCLQVLSAIRSSNVANGVLDTGESVATFASTAIRRAVGSFCLFWPMPESAFSLAGALLGKFVVSASKQHWLWSKGLGLV